MKLSFIKEDISDTVQVFGGGYIGRKTIYALKKSDIKVSAVLDNSEKKYGEFLWDDVPIIGPEKADKNIPTVLCFEKEKVKDIVRNQCKELGFKIITEVKLKEVQLFLNQLPDREYLEVMHYSFHGKKLEIENPKTLNEKLQWLKLHDRNPIYVRLGDKYKAREYLREKFGGEYLIPLLYMSYDYNDITSENIPNEHCAIKSNCWSGDVELIRSKEKVDWNRLRIKFKSIFESDWSKTGREWWYSLMKPCIVVEKLLETKEGKLPNDYKLHFFNGKLQFIYCSIDREGANYRKIYSSDWNEMPFSWNGEGTPPDAEKPNIPRPVNFDLMVMMGGEIAKEVAYVRVDFYEVDGKLYFGEVTLSHGAGFDRFVPEKYDLIYGGKLTLPQLKGENVRNHLEKFKEYTAPAHGIWSKDSQEWEKVLKLDWNESTISPSPKVINRIRELAQSENFYQYYPNVNNIKLLREIAKYVGLDEQNVQVFASSDSAHEYIAKVWVRNGDKCGILWPAYDNYRATMELAAGDVSYCEMPDYEFNEGIVCRYLEDERPRVFYICNPNNPTGEQIPIHSIRNLIERFPEVLFIIDEAYGEFSGESASELVREFANIVISRTFSKAFGLANFRIGYVISAIDNIRMLTMVRNGKNISTFAQEAAIAALEDAGYMRRYVSAVNEAREMFHVEVEQLPYIRKVYHSRANFVMLELENYRVKSSLIRYLLNNNIYIRDLGQTGYISEHCCRVTIGTKEQMTKVINVMKEFDPNEDSTL